MSEESSNVPQFVSFVSVDGIIVFGERLLEVVTPNSADFAEPFTDEAVELGVRALLRATFDYHVAKFDLCSGFVSDSVSRAVNITHLVPCRNLHVQQFMNGFFEVERVHDGKVDGSSHVDEICFSHILDSFFFGCS